MNRKEELTVINNGNDVVLTSESAKTAVSAVDTAADKKQMKKSVADKAKISTQRTSREWAGF